MGNNETTSRVSPSHSSQQHETASNSPASQQAKLDERESWIHLHQVLEPVFRNLIPGDAADIVGGYNYHLSDCGR